MDIITLVAIYFIASLGLCFYIIFTPPKSPVSPKSVIKKECKRIGCFDEAYKGGECWHHWLEDF